MFLTIHSKYKYFDSTAERAEDRRQKFHFCRLPFAVNVMLNLSIISLFRGGRIFFELEPVTVSKLRCCRRAIEFVLLW